MNRSAFVKTKTKAMRIVSVCILICLFVFPQDSFGQRKKRNPRVDLGLSIGLFPTYFKDKSEVTVLPIQAHLSYRLHPNLSVGVLAGYSESRTNWDESKDEDPDQWENKFALFGLRATAHAMPNEELDIYGGLIIGYTQTRVEILQGNEEQIFRQEGLRPYKENIISTGFIGIRYQMGKRLGLFTELGLDISLLKAGISARI